MKTRFALLALLCATVAFALDVPPPPSQWVTDTAGVLQPDQLSALNRKLSDFEQSSGSQFIIYIFPSLEGQPVEDFTIRCVQKWKVGQKKYDNGLVLFVFVKDRKVRIEVGYGLEGSVTDAYSSRVIRDYIAPHFQQSDYYSGLNAASDALIAKIRGGEAPVPPANPRPSPQQGRGGGNPGFGSVIPILILIVFLVFILPMLRRRGGGCGGCLWPMLFMGGGRGGMTFGGGGGGGWGGGGGFGGFSGGGGSFGGGGATGGW